MTDDLVKRLRERSRQYVDNEYNFDKRAADRIEKLEARVEELESIQECACAYDTPTDICAFHKRLFDRITTVRRDRIEKLEAALQMVVDWDNTLEFEDSPAWGDVMEVVQKALEGKDE